MRLLNVAELQVHTRSFSLFLLRKADSLEKVKVTAGLLRISSCAQIWTKMVILLSSQSQRGKVLKVQSERGTGQEPIHTSRRRRFSWQIARQSHLHLIKKLRWKERSVFRRKLLNLDWFASRKNKIKSDSNKKRQKWNEKNYSGSKNKGSTTWIRSEQDLQNIRSTEHRS